MGVTVREKAKGSGVWWVFIKHHGQRRSKLVGKRSAAEKLASKIRAELILSDFGLSGKASQIIPQRTGFRQCPVRTDPEKEWQCEMRNATSNNVKYKYTLGELINDLYNNNIWIQDILTKKKLTFVVIKLFSALKNREAKRADWGKPCARYVYNKSAGRHELKKRVFYKPIDQTTYPFFGRCLSCGGLIVSPKIKFIHRRCSGILFNWMPEYVRPDNFESVFDPVFQSFCVAMEQYWHAKEALAKFNSIRKEFYNDKTCS